MRQFLAVDLSDGMRDALAALQERLRGSFSGWRWIPPESVHLTLRFLGEVDGALDAEARPRWRRAAEEARRCRCEGAGVGAFPPRGAPRVLWVGVRESRGGSALASLAEALENEARSLGLPAETRGFRPHLTVGRSRKDCRAARPRGLEDLTLPGFPVETVTLFRSRLSPAGAAYDILERFPVGAGRGDEGPA